MCIALILTRNDENCSDILLTFENVFIVSQDGLQFSMESKMTFLSSSSTCCDYKRRLPRSGYETVVLEPRALWVLGKLYQFRTFPDPVLIFVL